MPVVVMFKRPDDAGSLKTNGQLDASDTYIEKILIPDQFISKTLCNAGDRPPFLEGVLDEIHRTESSSAKQKRKNLDLKTATLRISGKLVACQDGEPRTLAEGLRLTIKIIDGQSADKQPGVGKWASKLAILDAGGEVFRKILLMIFLPLLAITFLRTPLEGKTISNIRKLGGGLLFANFLVAVFGLLVGAGVAACMRPGVLGIEEIKSELGVIDGQTSEASYEAHPVIKAITQLIPSHPLDALGDAGGNNALQILLIAGTFGLLLSFANDRIKVKAAKTLKQGAAFLVPDRLYSSRSLMDLVQPLIPLGVFCLTASLACTMHLGSAKAVMAGVLMSTLLSQVAVALLIALVVWRWHPGGFQSFGSVIRLSWPGIATAGATMSSFAALPELFTLPFIKENQERQSLLNLGIALNKLGATAYLAAAGGFIAILTDSSHPFSLVALVLTFSVITPIFAGGVPFAAVFALGLVLQYTTPLPGPAWWVISIEPLLDPIVTMVNVVANLVASTCFIRGHATEQMPAIEPSIAAKTAWAKGAETA
jgi:Na+/H+-dicarboxylate symporter